MPKNGDDGLDRELEQIELEMKRLQITHLRFEVEKESQRRADIARTQAQQQQSLKESQEALEARQAICPHKKGGKNIEGINHGTAQEYAVFTHTYADGRVVPMCTRCGKEWHKPPVELRRSDPPEYKRLLKEYVESLKFPTDNEPSGTQLFMITQYTAADMAAKILAEES